MQSSRNQDKWRKKAYGRKIVSTEFRRGKRKKKKKRLNLAVIIIYFKES